MKIACHQFNIKWEKILKGEIKIDEMVK